MSSGYNAVTGRVTFPTFARGNGDSYVGLVLEVVEEGFGDFAGLTVISPDTGEHVDLPVRPDMHAGWLDYFDQQPEGAWRTVVVPYEALERFSRTKERRIETARHSLIDAERNVQLARERLAAVEGSS